MSYRENPNMPLVNITEAAKLIGKSTQTLYRHIKAGKLSKHASGKLETSELIRVYGELSQYENKERHVTSHAVKQQNFDAVIAALQQQIEWLESEIKEVRADAQEREKQALDREKRLMALLEHQPSRDKSGGLFGKLFN